MTPTQTPIPLIHHTPRLLLLAASRALLTAELHKPHLFGKLLGAALPADWPPGEYDPDAMRYFLAQLEAGGPAATGWYGWYALRKAEGDVPRTLVGAGGFLGPPDAEGTAEIGFSLAADWRGQGLGTELVGGLVAQAAATGRVRRLLAHTGASNGAAQRALTGNGFAVATGPDPDAQSAAHNAAHNDEHSAAQGRLRFGRAVEAAPMLS